MITSKVLLVGNGINRVSNKLAWRHLINALIGKIGATGQIRVENKPFPLLYEEIYIEAVERGEFDEREIKEFIAERVSGLKKSAIHDEIIKLSFQDILTTNYDYNLEKVKIQNTSHIKNQGVVSEKRYNLFRNDKVDNTNFWHIHGECNLPSCIMLGFEHYSGYLQQMRNYVVTGAGSSYKDFEPEALEKRFVEKEIKLYSWIDFFFKKDIHILGFTFGFEEIHLWWILTYRARMKYGYDKSKKKKTSVENRIRYYYPAPEGEKIRNKLELLRSYNVLPVSVNLDGQNWTQYYMDALEKIRK